MPQDNTQRFSNRVEDYVKHRPGYPVETISFLQQHFNLTKDKTIADVGAGTGISTELFLKAGYTITAVEPNKEMRERSVELLSRFEKFTAVDGTAEQTNLQSNSVDAIIAGQAFHWFKVAETKKEFKRILKPNGLVVLIWNERLTESDFEKEYDALIVKHGNDYVQVDHRNINSHDIAVFYDPQPVALSIFPNRQVFGFEGLKGRLLSSSYMPVANAPGYPAMLADLKALFEKYKVDDAITINYSTKVYAGLL